MKNQTFGIEIELTGLTREEAAKTIAEYFGTRPFHLGGGYDAWTVKDQTGRTWKFMSDASIREECKTETPTTFHRVEFVSPICQYEDIETVQEAIRLLRKAGAKANSSCGIHVHIGQGSHTPNTLRNLANLVVSKEDMIYESLAIKDSRQGFCQKTDEDFIIALNTKKPKTMTGLADIWYGAYTNESRTSHYNRSRYHLLNFHSLFTIGTIEFRAYEE